RARSVALAPTGRRGRAGSGWSSALTAGSPLVRELATGLAGRCDALVLQGEGGQLGEGGAGGAAAGDEGVQAEQVHTDHDLGVVRGGEADEGGGVGAVADLGGAGLAGHRVPGHARPGDAVLDRV